MLRSPGSIFDPATKQKSGHTSKTKGFEVSGQTESDPPKKKTWLFSSHSSEAQLTILVETTDSLPTSTSGQKSAPGQRHTSSPQELLGHLRLTFLISCENMFYPNFTRPSTTGVLHTTGLFKVATSFSGCVYKMTA